MKLNLQNKIYAAVSVLLVVAIALKIIQHKPGSRYFYDANVCAPTNFPVYIREIYFTTANKNEDVQVNTEEVNNYTGGWGLDDFFAEVTEANLLPEKLILKYASFREGTFYNDTLALPLEKMKAIFKESLKNDAGIDIYYRGKQKPGLTFLIGIANNGNIIVWLKDKKGPKEVMRSKINAKVPTENDTYFGENMSKEQYLDNRFSSLSDSLKILIKTGYGANANYVDSAISY